LSVLRRRFASGLVYGVVSLVAAYLGGAVLAGAVLLMAMLASREYQRMIVVAGHSPLRFLQYGLTAFLVIGVASLSPDVTLGVFVLIFVSSLVWQITRVGEGQEPYVEWALTLAGAVYLGWLPAHFIILRALPGGLNWMLLTLAGAWSCDSIAYLFGKAFGKHAFFPDVSPRKTREGAAAGWVGGTLVVTLLGLVLGSPIVWAAGLGMVASLATICGDLAESLIKRQMGVKDSGGLVPGHGGMLDRIDSLLLAVVLVYYYVKLVPVSL
jgi:phosphatidate cytidylyltransferase